MEGEARSVKRSRDEPADTPETKRLREADFILEILDDDDVCRDPAVDELADVIKSLEEEISSPAVAEEQEVDGPRQINLRYLLEASDDELGLPPASGSSSPSPSAAAVGEAVETDGVFPSVAAESVPIWGFEDDINLELKFGADFDDGFVFDGGLFDYLDVGRGPSAYEDLSWQAQSLPTI